MRKLRHASSSRGPGALHGLGAQRRQAIVDQDEVQRRRTGDRRQEAPRLLDARRLQFVADRRQRQVGAQACRSPAPARAEQGLGKVGGALAVRLLVELGGQLRDRRRRHQLDQRTRSRRRRDQGVGAAFRLVVGQRCFGKQDEDAGEPGLRAAKASASASDGPLVLVLLRTKVRTASMATRWSAVSVRPDPTRSRRLWTVSGAPPALRMATTRRSKRRRLRRPPAPAASGKQAQGNRSGEHAHPAKPMIMQ